MLEFLLGMGTAIVLIALVAVGRSQGRRQRLAGSATAPPPTANAPDAPGRRELYALAENLQSYYMSSAYPTDLLEHEDFSRAVVMLSGARFSLGDVQAYVQGDNPLICCMALEALARRDDSAELTGVLLESINKIIPWPRFFALKVLKVAVPPSSSIVGPLLLRLDASWSNHPTLSFLEEFVRERLAGGETPVFGEMPETLPEEQVTWLRDLLQHLGSGVAQLLEELQQWHRTRANTGFLSSIGRVWEPAPSTPPIIQNARLTEVVNLLEATFTQKPARSVLLIGEPGVGKTAIVRVLASRLQTKGWSIFQAGHAELIAGQTFVGQFEERLRTLVQNLRGRQIIWYVPDFHMLTWTGRHHQSPIGALELVLPHIDAGEFTVLGETTPAAFERLVQSHPRCVAALDAYHLEPMEADATRELATQWARQFPLGSGAELIAAETLHEAWLLAQQYLGDKAAPGNLIDLIEITRQRLAGPGRSCPRTITLDDLIVTLTRLTGLPPSLLDERQGLDLGGLRRHFEQRVMGQPEAVDCLVERVAMIKASVNDPRRPLGVFLFVGPTGTGKTEIAKVLTEFLFGAVDRMIRLDMTEFQEPDSLNRILGGDPRETQGGALVELVRKQPFSVVLLDEFEKAHPAVWDLFLQVFDDGRLTDRRGATANCRHTLFILTTNLGGALHTSARLGFSRELAPFRPDELEQAVSQAFRKEFLNRLDRIVVFRPLSRESMREILHKELDEAFQRRGLRNRRWAVVWDDTALEFLLEKGFTSDLGARPLKRAIDRHLLTPLAMTIVKHQFPEGDQFLFVKSGESGLEVEFVDPDAPGESTAVARPIDTEAGVAPETLRVETILLDARGTAEEVERLAEQYEKLRLIVTAPSFQETKQAALALAGQPDFWASAGRFSVLGEVEYIDRIETGFQTAGVLLQKLTRRGERPPASVPRHLVERLAEQLYLLAAACETVRNNEPRDAFLLVESVPDTAASTRLNNDFARQLGQMYRAWAKKRRMDFRVLDEQDGNAVQPYRLLMAVSGYAAYRLLAPEHGLHVYETPQPSEKSEKAFRRAKVLVAVEAQPDEPAGAELAAWRAQADAVYARSQKARTAVVRRYRAEPSPLVRDSVRDWRTGRLERVLSGDFDLFT
ncbi:MAG: AAA family ATPase [Planctomycetota bacterium]